jgi:putative ABC transport system permease protein
MMSPRDYLDLRAQTRSFEHFAANWGNGLSVQGSCSLAGESQPEPVLCASVTHNFFAALGVRPFIGKGFVEADEGFRFPQVAVFSHRLWLRWFGGDPLAIGKRVKVDGSAVTVIGVMPSSFDLPARCDLWLPPPFYESILNSGMRLLRPIARLKAGVSLEEAERELQEAVRRLPVRSAENRTRWEGRLLTVKDVLVGDWRLGLLLLQGAACLVLLITCSNIANLLLVMGANRHKELAIRASVGASPARIVRQLFTENIILALLGGAAGVLLAMAGFPTLLSLSPAAIPRLGEAHIDGFVLGITVLVCLVAGVFFGLAPALAAARADLHISLREGGRAGRGTGKRMASVIVVAEVALATVLSASACLLLNSYRHLKRIDPGFNPGNLLTMKMLVSDDTYRTHPTRFFKELLERVRALPGVQAAATTLDLPLDGWVWDVRYTAASAGSGDQKHSAHQHQISKDYFCTMGIPLLMGRDFRDSDTIMTRYEVAIVNDDLARRTFGVQNVLGQRIFDEKGKSREIVGIVGNVRHRAIDAPAYPEIYSPNANHPVLVVRSTMVPESLVSGVRAAIRALDPEIPLDEVRTMDGIVSASLARQRFWMMLLGLFALLAQALAALGVYGVISYSVNQRSAEFGIRMAVGARPVDVLKQVVVQTLRLAAAGVAIGILGIFAVARLIGSLLYQVSASDPLILISTALAVIGIALVAGFLPARRAMRIDPMAALRSGEI